MVAANQFINSLSADKSAAELVRIKVELFGSLGATGKGHGSDVAVLLGLQGEQPHSVDVEKIDSFLTLIRSNNQLQLPNKQRIEFIESRDLIMHKRRTLPFHPNGMTFTALCGNDNELFKRTYFSVGGGFVLDEDAASTENPIKQIDQTVPYPFTTGDRLLEICKESGLSIAQIMMANETVVVSEQDVRERILAIWAAMQDCVKRGCRERGILPGGMKVKRRAAELFDKLDEGIVDFLLTAGAIGILYKENASISGAEVGCQGEVGSACSMAAGALTAVLNGTPEQVENAAEIGMEHNLGLTCDPVGGLVQVPCIERNAMASVKAINASRIALRGDGTHFVSLDKVIKTMRDTGADMKTKYKETARGGLAINVIEVPVSFPDC